MNRAQVLETPRQRREEAGKGLAGGSAGRVWLVYAPVLLLGLMGAFALGDLFGRAPNTDFLGFWTAARLALSHDPAAAYDPAAQVAAQGLGDHFFAFLYPPQFLLLVLPFGLLPYGLALTAWRAIGLAAYLIAARRVSPGMFWTIAAYPAALAALALGQSSLLLGALLTSGLLLIEERPLIGGLLLGGLICKPQLAILAPLALIAAGQTRALAGAALGAGGLLIASLLAFGWPLFASFATSGSLDLIVFNDAGLWPKMVGLYPSLRLLGLGASTAGALQLALTIACAALVWLSWRSRAPFGLKIAILAVCDMLATPYAFTYDLVILMASICWLVADGLAGGVRSGEKAALAAIYALPLASPWLARVTGLNLAWLVLALFLAALLRRLPASQFAASPCFLPSRPVSPAHGRFAHPSSASAYQPLGALGAAFRRGRARRG